MAPASARSVVGMPWIYSLFFLYIEPVATLAGAVYAHFLQAEYMHMTYPTIASSAALDVSTGESIVLTQLANMYLAFALNEALVLRATTDRRVWSTLLLGLLIADFGHLYSVRSLGFTVYYRFWEWNAMYWGNLGFVYAGASFRSAFLLGLGFSSGSNSKKAKV